MLNWTVWNRTVFGIKTVYLIYAELFEIEMLFTFKTCTYAKPGHWPSG